MACESKPFFSCPVTQQPSGATCLVSDLYRLSPRVPNSCLPSCTSLLVPQAPWSPPPPPSATFLSSDTALPSRGTWFVKTPDSNTPSGLQGGSEFPRPPHWVVFLGITGSAPSYLEGFVLGSLMKEDTMKNSAIEVKTRIPRLQGCSRPGQVFMVLGWFLQARTMRASLLMWMSHSLLVQVSGPGVLAFPSIQPLGRAEEGKEGVESGFELAWVEGREIPSVQTSFFFFFLSSL